MPACSSDRATYRQCRRSYYRARHCLNRHGPAKRLATAPKRRKSRTGTNYWDTTGQGQKCRPGWADAVFVGHASGRSTVLSLPTFEAGGGRVSRGAPKGSAGCLRRSPAQLRDMNFQQRSYGIAVHAVWQLEFSQLLVSAFLPRSCLPGIDVWGCSLQGGVRREQVGPAATGSVFWAMRAKRLGDAWCSAQDSDEWLLVRWHHRGGDTGAPVISITSPVSGCWPFMGHMGPRTQVSRNSKPNPGSIKG